eukprot:gb/GECG01001548.1/.p1 GENE.gb/GECG01001548.1/~~gb/GECG01001548.1/.p1  ORF type:complete len:110 (+),score=10.11 gb/GECG01001548.1/:1-330(+)
MIFQSVSPSSTMARTPSTLTARMLPVLHCFDPSSTKSSGSLSPPAAVQIKSSMKLDIQTIKKKATYQYLQCVEKYVPDLPCVGQSKRSNEDSANCSAARRTTFVGGGHS